MYPRKTTFKPFTLSQDLVFILCGMAEDPTCPSLKPSVTKSCPAISRILVAKEDGPAEIKNKVEITSKSIDLG